jgi:transketolase
MSRVVGPVAPPREAERASEPYGELEDRAREIRMRVLQLVHDAGAGHLGGPLSSVDVLVALYFRILRVDPLDPAAPARDRFILSKGHSSPALYATLAVRGYLRVEELATFDSAGSRLQAHPDMKLLPGIDMSTGSLGQGLSAGVGMALAARLSALEYRTFVLLGDGECQEGQVWEAAMVASRYGLERLTAIVDVNRLQQFGWHRSDRPPAAHARPLVDAAEKWRAFGWDVDEVDGHDFSRLVPALERVGTEGKPRCVLARTVKGKGVSFMEGDYLWHSRTLSETDLRRALDELAAR